MSGGNRRNTISNPALDLEIAVGALEWLRTCPLVDENTDAALQRVSVWLGRKARELRHGRNAKANPGGENV